MKKLLFLLTFVFGFCMSSFAIHDPPEFGTSISEHVKQDIDANYNMSLVAISYCNEITSISFDNSYIGYGTIPLSNVNELRCITKVRSDKESEVGWQYNTLNVIFEDHKANRDITHYHELDIQ